MSVAMLFTQRWALWLTIVTLLCIFTTPILSEQLDVTNLTLLETAYNSTLTSLESDGVSTKYTLPEFLSSVVEKTGFSTTNTAEEDQALRYYQSGFRWDPNEDINSSHWEPLAVSTWQDSLLDGTDVTKIDNSLRGVTVVSWKDNNKDKNAGMKVTFVVNGTWAEGSPRKYAHVLLVNNVAKKKEGGVSFDVIDPSNTHGGIVWYGGWLYVGDGKNGLRAFDVSHIWRVNSTSAFGMEYILPQARMYNPSGFPDNYRSFTFDFLSIDRNSTPPCILIGEYKERKSGFTYFAKWPLDGKTGRLATNNVNGGLIASATWAFRFTILRVRGMVYARAKYFIGSLNEVPNTTTGAGDENEKGQLWIWTPGELIDPIPGVLPRGVGGMSYGPVGDGLWVVAVTEGNRGVIGINAGSYTGNNVPPVINTTSTQAGGSGTGVPNPTSNAPNNNKDGRGNTTSGSNQPTGAIVGGVIGGVITGALLISLLFMYRRRRESRHAERHISQGASHYPPPGFVQGTHEYGHKGEIPMIKSELDASATQVNEEGYAAAVARSSGSNEHIVNFDEWGQNKGLSRIPARKPVPMATPETNVGGKGGGPWAELEAVEKPAQLPP